MKILVLKEDNIIIYKLPNMVKGNLWITDFDEYDIEKNIIYFSEINALHPFREGNGRSQREFIRSLALKNGYVIHFDRISESEMVLASQKSFLCDYSDMEKLFSKCITKK